MKYLIPFILVMAWNASAACPQETLKMANQIFKMKPGEQMQVEGYRYMTFAQPNWMKVKVTCVAGRNRGGNDLEDTVVPNGTCTAIPFVTSAGSDIQYKVFQCS